MSAQVTVACPHCSKPVTAYRSTLRTDGTKFCSRACHDAHRTLPPITRVCAECDTEFVPFRATRETAQWCSRECYQKAGSVDHPCAGCGETFRAHRSVVQRSTTGNLYCPTCCAGADGEKLGRGRVMRTTVQCAHCGADKEMRITDVARSKRKRFFCNAECRKSSEHGARGRATQEIPCQVCGNTFTTRAGVRAESVCSPGCRSTLSRDSRLVRHCRQCGERFARFLSQPDVYCSAQCARDSKKPTGDKARRIDENGYVVTYRDPDVAAHRELGLRGWVLEHRAVMAELLNRPLRKGENVHHLNTDRSDNTTDGPLRWVNGSLRSGNLELWVKSQPSGGRLGETGPFDAQLYPGVPA